jgi:hypothetical protein
MANSNENRLDAPSNAGVSAENTDESMPDSPSNAGVPSENIDENMTDSPPDAGASPDNADENMPDPPSDARVSSENIEGNMPEAPLEERGSLYTRNGPRDFDFDGYNARRLLAIQASIRMNNNPVVTVRSVSPSSNIYATAGQPNGTDMAGILEPITPDTESDRERQVDDAITHTQLFDLRANGAQISNRVLEAARRQPPTIFMVSRASSGVQGQQPVPTAPPHPFYGHIRPRNGTPRFPVRPLIRASDPTIQGISDSLRTDVPAPSVDARSVNTQLLRTPSGMMPSEPEDIDGQPIARYVTAEVPESLSVER